MTEEQDKQLLHRHLLASLLFSTTEVALGQPLDTLKTCMQIGTHRINPMSGVYTFHTPAASSILNNESLIGTLDHTRLAAS